VKEVMEIEVNDNRIRLHDFLMFQAQYDIKLKEKNKEIERLTEINKNLENAISLNNIRKLQQENKQLHSTIKEVREYIEHYETIRGYYVYEELGYDEYNYDEELKQELLAILDKENI